MPGHGIKYTQRLSLPPRPCSQLATIELAKLIQFLPALKMNIQMLGRDVIMDVLFRAKAKFRAILSCEVQLTEGIMLEDCPTKAIPPFFQFLHEITPFRGSSYCYR